MNNVHYVFFFSQTVEKLSFRFIYPFPFNSPRNLSQSCLRYIGTLIAYKLVLNVLNRRSYQHKSIRAKLSIQGIKWIFTSVFKIITSFAPLQIFYKVGKINLKAFASKIVIMISADKVFFYSLFPRDTKPCSKPCILCNLFLTFFF